MPVHFGTFALDESSRQLRDGQSPVRLTPKAFQLLSILVHESPAAVSKKDLQQRLWPDTFVTEGNLAGLVVELRSALHDDARGPRFIRTLYGFGYSFAAPVDVAPAAPQRHRAVRWTAVGICAVLGATGVVLTMSLHSMSGSAPVAASVPVRSIAILPFDASGSDRNDQQLGIGLPDLLITRLSNVHQLIVRPTSTMRSLANRHIDANQAGRDLKVDAVLEGSIRTTPDRVRVTVQLLNVRDGKTMWADHFDQKRAEMFSIEDDISVRVADALMPRLTTTEHELLTKQYTTNPDAYALYIEGRSQMRQGRQERAGAHNAALQLFQKAVEKDPRYALAWAGVAQAYAGMGAVSGGISPRDAWTHAEAAAQTALRLDGNLAEAHTALGCVRMYWDLDFAGAEREFVRALQLNPRNQGALAYYAFLLQAMRRFDEDIALHEREIAVDPFSPAVQWGLANAYLTARRDDRGIAQTLMVIGMDPTMPEPHIALTREYALRCEFDHAIEEGRRAVDVSQGTFHFRALAFLGYAYGMAGRRADAVGIVQSLKKDDGTPFNLAVVFMGLGDREAAIVLLGKALDERSYAIRLNTEPVFEPLRFDPRFVALLRRAGFRS